MRYVISGSCIGLGLHLATTQHNPGGWLLVIAGALIALLSILVVLKSK